jgi:hypothetical protein
MHTEFWWGNMKERDHFENQVLVGGRNTVGLWAVFTWPKMRTSGMLLCK